MKKLPNDELFWNQRDSKNGSIQRPKVQQIDGRSDTLLTQKLVCTLKFENLLWKYNLKYFILPYIYDIFRHFGPIWQRLRWHIIHHRRRWRWRRRRRSINWMSILVTAAFLRFNSGILFFSTILNYCHPVILIRCPKIRRLFLNVTFSSILASN